MNLDECHPRSTFWKDMAEAYDYAVVRFETHMVELYFESGVLAEVFEHIAEHNVFCPAWIG